MLNQINKDKLDKILRQYDLIRAKQELESLVEKVLNNDATERDIYKYLTRDHDLNLIQASKIGLKISEQITNIKPIEKIKPDKAVEQLISQMSLTFVDDDLSKRFKNIVISYLNEVRSELETRITLKRDQKIGGVGYDDEKVDKIIEILNKEKPKITIDKKENTETKIVKELKTQEQIISAETTVREVEKIEPKVEQKQKLPPGIKKVMAELKDKPIKPELQQRSVLVEPKVAPVSESAPQVKVQMAPESAVKLSMPQQQPPETESLPPESEPSPPKSVMSSVKEPEYVKIRPKVHGPIEELRTLTLADWKRFGTPEQASQRIQDKINLLAEESLTKKAEGIKAWKESEINRLYLKAGEGSINQGISVSEIIKQWQQKGQPTLTEEEFNIVVELNESLRF